MEAGISRAAEIALALLLGVLSVAAAGGPPDGCRIPSASEWIVVPPETCSLLNVPAAGVGFEGIVEGDEIALQRAANMVAANKDQYVVVLFYASWCPFSKKCLPNFNSMASLFPSIPHFAFEESVIRPSVLSRYGVHGFPTFFLLHSSMRVRYHGSRSISSLTFFYSNVTGLAPTSLDSTALKKATIVTNITEHTSGQESCPFSWARSPEKLLQQDTYLALATSFVILRLLYFLWPKLAACFKIAWRRQSRFASLMSLWDYFQSFLQQAKRGSFSRLKHSKRSNLQEGAISAKAWASKSLVSVSFGEPGSVRAQSPPMRGDK